MRRGGARVCGDRRAARVGRPDCLSCGASEPSEQCVSVEKVCQSVVDCVVLVRFDVRIRSRVDDLRW
jgi:hypothetical protein